MSAVPRLWPQWPPRNQCHLAAHCPRSCRRRPTRPVVAVFLLGRDSRSLVGTPVRSGTGLLPEGPGCRMVAHVRATAQVVWTQVRPRRAMYWPMRTGPRHSGHQLLRRAFRVLWARIIFPPFAGPCSRTESHGPVAGIVLRALSMGVQCRIATCWLLRPKRLSCRAGKPITLASWSLVNGFVGGARRLYLSQ
jgi:hypothetical protein